MAEHIRKSIRILVIAGSSRRETNCPAADSKASYFAARAKEKLPKDWTVDVFNVGNDCVLPKIQSCNACVSTSMALCVWPCNCYERHSFFEPDLMWDEDIYGRIYAADAIMICSPVNWYGPTSSMKMMFDRLICANGGNPDEKLIKHKDGALAARLEHDPKWKELSLNHLEGRTAGFFVYGDDGGDEIDKDGSPLILRHKEYFNSEEEAEFDNPMHAYSQIIWQCRYMGIEVPQELVKGKVPQSKYPVPLKKPDSAMHPFARQLQLLIRTILGNLWVHSLGYFASRYYAKKLRLDK